MKKIQARVVALGFRNWNKKLVCSLRKPLFYAKIDEGVGRTLRADPKECNGS
jgi:hypothetical protein